MGKMSPFIRAENTKGGNAECCTTERGGLKIERRQAKQRRVLSGVAFSTSKAAQGLVWHGFQLQLSSQGCGPSRWGWPGQEGRTRDVQASLMECEGPRLSTLCFFTDAESPAKKSLRSFIEAESYAI